MNIVNKSLDAFIVVSYTFYIGLHQVFVYQVDVDVIISRHTLKEIGNEGHILNLRQYSR